MHDPRHVARLDRPRRGSPALRGSCCRDLGHPAAGERHGDLARGSARGRRARSASRSSSGRRTCSAAAAWRSSTTSATLDRYMTQRGRRVARASGARSTSSSRTRSSSTSTAVADATGAVVIGGIMEHIEEAGIHSGDSSCVVPPFICPERHLGDDPRLHAAHRARAQGRRPDERAVRDQGRRRLRARSEPARVAHGAVPVEGDRRAAGEDRGEGDGRPDAGRARADRGPRGRRRVREEPGVPVRALPGRRHDSRAGDEVDRRGDGRRRRTSASRSRRRSWRSGSGCRRRAPRSSASTTTTSRTCCRSRATSRSSGFTLDRHARHGRLPARARPRRRRRLQGERRPAERRRRDRQPQDRSRSSTRRSAASRSSTIAPCAAPR